MLFPITKQKKTMKDIFRNTKYTCDPHGAVGYQGLEKYLQNNPQFKKGVFFETAHPAKFKNIVDETIKTDIQIPARLAKFLNQKKLSIKISKEFRELKELMLSSDKYR